MQLQLEALEPIDVVGAGSVWTVAIVALPNRGYGARVTVNGDPDTPRVDAWRETILEARKDAQQEVEAQIEADQLEEGRA